MDKQKSKKKKRGAPLKNQNARKSDTMIKVSLYGTLDQIDAWLEQAEKDGKELSPWLRDAANEKAGM